MQYLRFAPLALAASVSAETLANILSANNDTLSTLNGKPKQNTPSGGPCQCFVCLAFTNGHLAQVSWPWYPR